SAAADATLLSESWQIYCLSLDATELADLKWKAGASQGPAFWRGTFNAPKTADTFLDLSNWGKGVAWINGHCLARFWNIGPTQTLYPPVPWLKTGKNELIILDLLGPTEPTVAGLERPILDKLRSELDVFVTSTAKGTLSLAGAKPAFTGTFKNSPDV